MAANDKIRLVNRDLVCRQYIAGEALVAGDPVDVKAAAAGTVLKSDLDNSTAPVGFALKSAAINTVVSIVIGGKLYSPTGFVGIIQDAGALADADAGCYLVAHADSGKLTHVAPLSLTKQSKIYAYVLSAKEIEVLTFTTGPDTHAA